MKFSLNVELDSDVISSQSEAIALLQKVINAGVSEAESSLELDPEDCDPDADTVTSTTFTVVP